MFNLLLSPGCHALRTTACCWRSPPQVLLHATSKGAGWTSCRRRDLLASGGSGLIGAGSHVQPVPPSLEFISFDVQCVLRPRRPTRPSPRRSDRLRHPLEKRREYVLSYVLNPGFAKPLGTGPVWPVTSQIGPARFWFGPVPNRLKFKIQIWIQKNEKFPKNPKNTSRCDESNGVNFFQKFVGVTYFSGI